MTAPLTPARDRAIDVDVVGRRCVYVNSYRVAGGKPYVSEGLSSYTLTTTLGNVLDAFSETEIMAALREAKGKRDYWTAFHAAKSAEQVAS